MQGGFPIKSASMSEISVACPQNGQLCNIDEDIV